MVPFAPLELNRAVPGGRIEMYAIKNESYPGGWFYRFQFYHPDSGPILRYDNSHYDDDIGWHHRHWEYGRDTELPFQNIVSHVGLFLREVELLTTYDHDI